MGFKTKLDFGNNNRQAKQHQYSEIILSGKTTFGVTNYLIPPEFTGDTINIEARQYIQAGGLIVIDGTQQDGYVLTSDANGKATWKAVSATTSNDNYVSSADFNTSDGVLTLNMISGGTVTVDLDNRYNLTGHTHTESDITDFQDYSLTGHTHIEYSPTGHTHTESDITDLQDYSLTGHTHIEYSPTGHTHTLSGLTDTELSATTNGYLLTYVASTGKWEAVSGSTGSSEILQKIVSGSTYTMLSGDSQYSTIFFDNGTEITVTINNDLIDSFEVGLHNIGAGDVTFSAGTATRTALDGTTLTTDKVGALIKVMTLDNHRLKGEFI